MTKHKCRRCDAMVSDYGEPQEKHDEKAYETHLLHDCLRQASEDYMAGRQDIAGTDLASMLRRRVSTLLEERENARLDREKPFPYGLLTFTDRLALVLDVIRGDNIPDGNWRISQFGWSAKEAKIIRNHPIPMRIQIAIGSSVMGGTVLMIEQGDGRTSRAVRHQIVSPFTETELQMLREAIGALVHVKDEWGGPTQRSYLLDVEVGPKLTRAYRNYLGTDDEGKGLLSTSNEYHEMQKYPLVPAPEGW